jgi:hypothetical protein
MMQMLGKRYGSAFTVRLPSFGRTVMISDPALVKQLFQTRTDVVRNVEPNLDLVLGPGSTFGLQDEEHRRRRKLPVPPFHGKRMRAYEDLVEEETLKEIATWPEGHEFAVLPSTNRIAATVCPEDPRTTTQRRTDALTLPSAGAATMPYACGSPDCPAASADASSHPVVITVIADAATVEGTSLKPGYLPGYGAVPAATVQQMAKTAFLRPVPVPKDLVAEPHYRPSAGLARFIGCRDLTCRWPGCDQPAQRCDIDHTVPYPHGPTHPSGNKLYCRIHRLFKTFHAGPLGWIECQLPDGTIT